MAWRLLALTLLGACSFRARSISDDASPVDTIVADAGFDARIDAPIDAGADAMPPTAAFAAAAVMSANGASSLTYPLTIPAGSDRFLLVSVQLGTNCPAGVVPNITSVAYNGVALTQLATIVGTPCGMTTTRSDQWQLVAPATGTHNVVVSLGGQAQSVHSGAMAFTGIDPSTPVRSSMKASGTGASSTVTVVSASGDLVVNTVGQGTSITAPGSGQTQRYLHNSDSSNTLNNSAGSTAPGAAMVTMTWTFGAVDEWQTISTSLRP